MQLVFKNKYEKAVCPINVKHPCIIDTEEQKIYCFICGFAIPLEEYLLINGIELHQETEEERTIKQILKEANEIYRSHLQKCDDVISYLYHRGVTKQSIETFQLGYAPRDIISKTLSKKYPVYLLVESGLCYLDNTLTLHDSLSNRITIPIINYKNEIVAFSGRCLKKGKGIVKYKNTRNTKVFKKSHVLFGENLIDKNKERIYIVEGYMDVIILQQEGYNAVSPMGIALSLVQYSKIKNFPKKYILFDGDSAGYNASQKLKQQFPDLTILSLPEGMDPDEFVLTQSKSKSKSA